MEMDTADILVEVGVEYTYQVWAMKKSENAEFQIFELKAYFAVSMGEEEIRAEEVVHFSKSSEITFKTVLNSDPPPTVYNFHNSNDIFLSNLVMRICFRCVL